MLPPPPPLFSCSKYREGGKHSSVIKDYVRGKNHDYEMVTLFMGQKATLKTEVADFSKMLVSVVS